LQKQTQSCTLVIDDYNDQAIPIGLFSKERLRMAASPPRKRKLAAKSTRDGGPQEAAHFIAEQLPLLARLARRHKLNTLGLLLDMSLMEAREKASRRKKR
jgi:hypothetical protein